MCCPRCAYQDVRLLATSPVPDVWQVHQCARCHYTWRSTEPAERTTRDAYPEPFRMTERDIADATQVPAVPPLASSR